MKGKKLIYLFLALALPGLIYVFLRQFGRNEFDLQVYYREDVPVTSCDKTLPIPYLIPDSVLAKPLKVANLFYLEGDSETESNLNRLSDEISAELYYTKKVERRDDVLGCALALKEPWTVVMIDSMRQIRGYYAPSTREEFDRLKMEMDILLKRY